MTLVPAEMIAQQRALQRMRSVNEIEPTRGLARRTRRHADAIAEWGAADGDLRFYRSSLLLMIARERKGAIDGLFRYMTPGALAIEWAEIVKVAWKLRGEVAVKADGSWRKDRPNG